VARRIAGPWRSIVIGMTISAGLAAIAVAVSVGAFIYRHHDSKYVPQAAAEAEFERARRPFARQRPTVEVRDGADPVVSPRSASAMREHGAAAHTLHTLVFESRTGKLVRISLPFRVVRLMHPNGFTYLGGLTFLEDTEFDSDRVLLTLDDIERDEPTLVVDHRHPGGGRFLVWVD
jgi:hypothetical protein